MFWNLFYFLGEQCPYSSAVIWYAGNCFYRRIQEVLWCASRREDTSWLGLLAVAKGEQDSDVFQCWLLSVSFRCGSYPGLYTDVSRYYGWITKRLDTLKNEVWYADCRPYWKWFSWSTELKYNLSEVKQQCMNEACRPYNAPLQTVLDVRKNLTQNKWNTQVLQVLSASGSKHSVEKIVKENKWTYGQNTA